MGIAHTQAMLLQRLAALQHPSQSGSRGTNSTTGENEGDVVGPPQINEKPTTPNYLQYNNKLER